MVPKKHTFSQFTVAILTLFAAVNAFASEGGSAASLLAIAVILLLAKLSTLIERWQQPAVLGELVIGIIIGNIGLLGFHYFESIKTDSMIGFLAELGVVILLFQVGLESSINSLAKVGLTAFNVAVVGVIVPFALGTLVVGPMLMPGLSANAYLFLGAALTATSVGITARVFTDLNKINTPEAVIVLGAAVIDDILGLIILAVVAAIATTGTVSVSDVGWIIGKAVGFLGAALLLASKVGIISNTFSKIHSGIGMKFTVAIVFCLVLAYAAHAVGLAPIVGAFAAGLLLEHAHFYEFDDPTIKQEIMDVSANVPADVKAGIAKILDTHSEKHIEDLMRPLGYFLVPIFFVLVGMKVNVTTLFNGRIIITALAITLVAFLGKLVTGLVAGKVNKWVIGWGMAPRGEVGLIFATMGRDLGVVTDELFSIIIIVVMLTTLLTPPILAYYLREPADAK